MPGSDGTSKSYSSLTSGVNVKMAFPGAVGVVSERLMPRPLRNRRLNPASGVSGVGSDRFDVAVTFVL